MKKGYGRQQGKTIRKIGPHKKDKKEEKGIIADYAPAKISEEYFDELITFIMRKKPKKMALSKYKVVLCRKLGAKRIPTDIEVLLNAKQPDLNVLRRYLSSKPMRTGSGVAVIAIMTRPYCCPHGKCTYCPGGPGSPFGDVPQSYTGNEPATLRGIRNDYDAYLQVMNRLEQYIVLGQNPDKVELIIMGGTFPSLPREYQDDFVRDALKAMNDFSRMFYTTSGTGLDDFKIEKFKEFFMLPGDISNKDRIIRIKEKLSSIKSKTRISLQKAQEDNEESSIRCIGMTIETKPDWGLLEHGNQMLRLGCTRIELGIQTLNDDVLRQIHRGHTLADTKKSIQELRDIGFKLNFHMMPGLPGISKEEDIETFKELFNNPSYRPDMLKIYPTMVMPGTKLYLDYKAGKFKPLDTMEAADRIAEAIRYVPKYCRIMRVQRDIPTKFSVSGIDKNNLRQLVEQKTREKKIQNLDIRSREIRDQQVKEPLDFEIIEYEASGGKECFISLVDQNKRLIGFLRLRLPGKTLRKEITAEASIIRELHIYGSAIAIGHSEERGKPQHRGYGKMLMRKAEEIARMNRKSKVLVLSGIGVREYYKKLGYAREGPYMSKRIIL